ncbi:hypothetical protein PIROE2DRAFT_16590 [Piromyces sp. E2]|nr:hypothetical protein PIROE2DRAFT_16590 [Piromyces sp. E2]|eukprot:OUM58200.1 hypothetical protein PIROE2DRAFT_16590 [Piromyces sp. E2]
MSNIQTKPSDTSIQDGDVNASLSTIIPEENYPIFKDNKDTLKENPLLFARIAQLSFLLNHGDPSFPIKCRKCGNEFTRSSEPKKNMVRFVCKSKNNKGCTVTCQCHDLKSYLMDLYNHDRLMIIKSKNPKAL